MPNAAQISLARTLLAKTGNAKQKEAIVSGFTGERTLSIKEMTDGEFSALIKHLKGISAVEQSAEKMRRRIISMAHELNWRLPGTAKADMRRIDEWCINHGGNKKKLDAHTIKELPKLVTGFQGMYNSYITKRSK